MISIIWWATEKVVETYLAKIFNDFAQFYIFKPISAFNHFVFDLFGLGLLPCSQTSNWLILAVVSYTWLNILKSFGQSLKQGLLIYYKIHMTPTHFHHHPIIALTDWSVMMLACSRCGWRLWRNRYHKNWEGRPLSLLVSNASGAVKGHLYV